MKLEKIVEALNLKIHTGAEHVGRDVSGGYAGDLLSDVLAHASEGDIWVTLHTHANIVAVANTKGISGIIVVQGRLPEEQTTRAAAEHEVPIFISDSSTFKTVSGLSKLGLL